jgi:hypothetical protein
VLSPAMKEILNREVLSGSCPLPFGSCRLQINHRFQKGTHPIQITVNYILILHNPTLVGFFVCGGDGRFELVNINILKYKRDYS